VQHVLRRRQKRAQLAVALTTGEPGDVLAAVDDELTCDE
jgi:hypothetical protein